MKKITKPINFEDERGFIQDILINAPTEHATLIFSKAGAVRGNHYHKDTVQYTYVLDGSIEYHYKEDGGTAGVEVMKKSDFIETPALEQHALKALTDATFLVLTRGPRGGDAYESDTFRLSEPLVTVS